MISLALSLRRKRRVLRSRTVCHVTVSIEDWAEQNFGSCELGDARRRRRAVQVARTMAEYPNGSTPDQFENWADLKAAYRLFDCKQVSFEALATPHWQNTRAQASGVVLLLGDTMETDFGIRRSVTGLGPTGDGYGLGFMLHSSLMVQADDGEIVGLAGQELFYRQPAPANENSYQALQRPRESEVWGRVIDQVGRPAEDVTYIHVFDRGADNLEVFCHLLEQKSDWVIRAAQLHRKVHDDADERMSVNELISQQPVLGTYCLGVRAAGKRSARNTKMEVRAVQATIRKPKRRTPYLKEKCFKELTQWIVEVREVNPPRGETPLRWVLWTSLKVDSFDAAWTVIEYYERRWLIEEFHKAIKTGCRLESRQYATADRLEAVAGIISVLAVRLVQLKTIARTQPNRPAKEIVPSEWLEMLQAQRKVQVETVRDFFRHLAGLGGFLMRKRDGEPGWITIWRGTEKLLQLLRGYHAMRKRSG